MTAACTIPRLVIAGVSSGVGRTDCHRRPHAGPADAGPAGGGVQVRPRLLTDLPRARRGLPVAEFDGWLMGRDAVPEHLRHAARGRGHRPRRGGDGALRRRHRQEGSTAEIAHWLEAPVALVADAAEMAQDLRRARRRASRRLQPGAPVGRLLANHVGSPGLLEPPPRARSRPILGGLPRRGPPPERHLGLRTADDAAPADRRSTTGASWPRAGTRWTPCSMCRSAPPVAVNEDPPVSALSWPSGILPIGLARDAAFPLLRRQLAPARGAQRGVTVLAGRGLWAPGRGWPLPRRRLSRGPRGRARGER